jgi:hypothetical protein
VVEEQIQPFYNKGVKKREKEEVYFVFNFLRVFFVMVVHDRKVSSS